MFLRQITIIQVIFVKQVDASRTIYINANFFNIYLKHHICIYFTDHSSLLMFCGMSFCFPNFLCGMNFQIALASSQQFV